MTANLVTVRPMSFSERAFVFSNCRRIVLEQLQDKPVRTCQGCVGMPQGSPPCLRHRYLDLSLVRDMVDHLVTSCTTRVAFVAGVGDVGRHPEIQGFIVDDERDGSIEFLCLRGAYDKMHGNSLRSTIVRELAGPRGEIVLRRYSSASTMEAAGASGSKVVVRPRSV